MSFKLRYVALVCAFLLAPTGCGRDDPPAFDFTDVRTVVQLLQQHFVDPVTEAALVEPGCYALVDFVREHGASSPVCMGVDTTEELQALYEAVSKMHGLSESELAVAINVAIADSLGHSHTSYTPLPQEDFREFSFEFSFVSREGGLLVWDLPIDSGAYKAGLRPGDTIVSIDGMPPSEWRVTADFDGSFRVKAIRPNLESWEFDSDYVQKSPNFIQARLLPGNLAYIRIRHFPPMQSQEHERTPTYGAIAGRTINEMHSKAPAGWILDVRGNRGGSSDMCAFIAGLFARSGYPIERPFWDVGQTIPIVWPQPLQDLGPVIVLVDGRSTSCSEIMAESIRQSLGASIVGEKTPGVAEASRAFRVGDGTLAVTVARIKIGRTGIDLEGVGVPPDHVVELTAGELARGHDAQLTFAIDLLMPGP
jgi:carboxyl-terminal processing protease